MTGSGARKLVRTGANLLGGRARTRHLYPLTSREIEDLDLLRVVNYGALPSIYQSEEPEEDLLAYCGTYLFFDVGAGNVLAGRKGARPKTELFGKCFEHFIVTELRTYLDYRRDRRELTFWRSTSGFEVDFLLGTETAIEVKGTDMVTEKHTGGLRALVEEIGFKQRVVVSLDPAVRSLGDVLVLPYQEFFTRLWAGEF